MIHAIHPVDLPRGHPRGGLFCFTGAVFTAALAFLAGCRPASSVDPGLTPIRADSGYRLPNPLPVYEKLGLLVGNERFAAVGRFVFLPGPADSTWAMLAVSIPNSALRFRRDPPGFLARYLVEIAVGDSAAPIVRLEETHEVRVRSFRETSSRGEDVIFQGLLTLLPGDYPARVRVADIASTAGFSASTDLHVPSFGPSSLTAPLVVYRGQARPNRDARPTLIVSPAARIDLDTQAGETLVFLESPADNPGPVILKWQHEGHVILVDTLVLAGSEGQLKTATAPVDVRRLPPGAVGLTAHLSGSSASDTSHLAVALQAEWLAADYQGTISLLRYAGTPAEMHELRTAAPEERARRLQAFWKRRDPQPETAENEFFQRYFRRLRDANDRFGDGAAAGWLTDRGAVYVTLGPPDAVARDLDMREGPERRQVWIYRESLGFELRLVFLDPTGTGALTLSDESRRAFRDAVQRLYS